MLPYVWSWRDDTMTLCRINEIVELILSICRRNFKKWAVHLNWLGDFCFKNQIFYVALYAKKRVPPNNIFSSVNIGTLAYKKALPIVIFIFVYFAVFFSHLPRSKYLTNAFLCKCSSANHYSDRPHICCVLSVYSKMFFNKQNVYSSYSFFL